MWKFTVAMVAIGSSASADSALYKCSVWGDLAQQAYTLYENDIAPSQIIDELPRTVGDYEARQLLLAVKDYSELFGESATPATFRAELELQCLDAPEWFPNPLR